MFKDRTFIYQLTEEEEKDASEFYAQHACCSMYTQISWIFSQTNIGMNVHIKCNVCEEDKDISDYDSW